MNALLLLLSIADLIVKCVLWQPKFSAETLQTETVVDIQGKLDVQLLTTLDFFPFFAPLPGAFFRFVSG